MPSRQEILRKKARYVANPLDYKKVIVERSFAKDWKPKYPLYPIPRMRNVVLTWFSYHFWCVSLWWGTVLEWGKIFQILLPQNVSNFALLIFFIFFITCCRLGASLSLAVSMTVKLFPRVGGMSFGGWVRTPQITTTSNIVYIYPI